MKLSELFETKDDISQDEIGSEDQKYFLVQIPKGCDLASKTNKEKRSSICGIDEGDGSFVNDQTIVTIEDIGISANGLDVKIYPMEMPEDYDNIQKKLSSEFRSWCSDQDGSYARLDLKKLPSNLPNVYDDFNCSYNELTSLEYAPKRVEGDCRCSNNKITSLHNIHKIFDSISGEFHLSGNPIKECVLGLLKIKKLNMVYIDNYKVEHIINKYLARDEIDIVECQSELIEAGLDEYAKL
jgi:hypothetical protein